MITRSVTRSAFSATVAFATGLLVLSPAPAPAVADSRTDPAVRAAGLPGAPVVTASPSRAASPSPGASSASPSPRAARSPRTPRPARSPRPSPTPAAAPVGPVEGALYRSGTQARPKRGTPAPPEVSALSWLVADVRKGDVLAAHDAHRPLPPASTLKTLFAVTALPRLPKDSEHTVSQAELDEVGEGSSEVGIVAGESYAVEDLWRGVFLSSGNDAVRALAEMNGGWDSTVKQMRVKAKLLGAYDTHVVSPDGYDADGQVSSAFDLAVFGRTGLSLPDFVKYSSTVDAQFPGYGGTFGILNTNRLLTGEDGVEEYPGLIGVKNGYTSEAGYTLIAAAKRGGRTMLVTVMNPQWGGVHEVYEEARALLDWGFRAAGKVTPVGSLVPPAAPLPPRPPVKDGPVPGPVARAIAPVPAPAPAQKPVSAKAPPARAAEEEPETGYFMPVVFIGSACLAAVALFFLRRTARHRAL
ncbi:D-alanyl-D-alanine carboxypeptidase [Streptomyces sp. NPDC002018]|uniref:D-alanyl-D-alanine carboxypeptidase family protein n=1 Tax=Streptomyces sp. NPDC002018 TaxID=3364629 RepID=UPI00369F640A